LLKSKENGFNPLLLSSGQSVGKWMNEQPSKDAFRKLQVLDLSQKPEDLSEDDYNDFLRDFNEEIKINLPNVIPAYSIAGLNALIKVS
jgi:hypothetical protein